MSKTSLRIGAFEIDDAVLHADQHGERTLSIPCKSDPDLCMQLDAWDADTSIPALLDGERSVLYRKHYDQPSDAWVMRLVWPKRNPPIGGLFIWRVAPLCTMRLHRAGAF